MDRVVESTRRRRRILTLVQEALSQLRLDMKYLVFDLEATRRERDAYRQKSGDDGPIGVRGPADNGQVASWRPRGIRWESSTRLGHVRGPGQGKS